jgi:hypothetical protein
MDGIIAQSLRLSVLEGGTTARNSFSE